MNKTEYLSEAELQRKQRFDKTAEELVNKGYRRHDLTVSIRKANISAVLFLIPLFIGGYGIYMLVHHEFPYFRFNPFIFLITYLILIVVHELIHGISWSLFTPHHFHDIEFGVMKPSLTPYCACTAPLRKEHHMFGTAMPFILLGVIPMIAGIAIAKPFILFMGILMADTAIGDLMILYKVHRYQSDAEDIVYMDHPTEAGGVIFEK